MALAGKPMFFRRRNRGGEATEAAQALEVRLARLAGEVQSALQRLEALEARQVAYTASVAEATDKLHRLVERGRKYAEARRRDAAGDDSEPDPDTDAFLEVYRRRGGLAEPPL
jgi:hypothetical protein